MRLTRQQWYALEFFEMSERDPVRLFGKPSPHTRTKRNLIKMMLITRIDVGQFSFSDYRLTDTGRKALREATK